jgi:hypothetical protein
MQILEMLIQFKARYGNKINPMLGSVKYCQDGNKAEVVLHYTTDVPPLVVNLDFISGDIETNESGAYVDSSPLFNPNADIVDNATTFLELDAYSIINCVTEIFTAEAAAEINDAYQQQSRIDS